MPDGEIKTENKIYSARWAKDIMTFKACRVQKDKCIFRLACLQLEQEVDRQQITESSQWIDQKSSFVRLVL